MPLKIRLLLLWVKWTVKRPLYDMMPNELRAFLTNKSDETDGLIDSKVGVSKITNQSITVRDGASIDIRIYHGNAQDNLPVIVYFHGGGFVLYGLDSHEFICRRIASDNNAIVVAVDYRLAPEYPYPTATQDAYDATLWVAENAHQFGGDASRLAVYGDSAGGNLATVVSLMARDLNGPDIKAQVLIYPCVDAKMSFPSITRNGEGYLLTKKLIEWFNKHYIPRGIDLEQPYLSPIFAKNLTQLPDSLILTAEYDPLIDEAAEYANRLRKAGNNVQYTEYKGLIHSFLGMTKLSNKVMTAHREVSDFLKKRLHQGRSIEKDKATSL